MFTHVDFDQLSLSIVLVVRMPGLVCSFVKVDSLLLWLLLCLHIFNRSNRYVLCVSIYTWTHGFFFVSLILIELYFDFAFKQFNSNT